jgi:hypothetical protein
MELQVAQMEFIRQERDALSSEKASLERAVAEMARLNSKLAARVAASAVGAIDAASVGLDFSALVPKIGAEADKKNRAARAPKARVFTSRKKAEKGPSLRPGTPHPRALNTRTRVRKHESRYHHVPDAAPR